MVASPRVDSRKWGGWTRTRAPAVSGPSPPTVRGHCFAKCFLRWEHNGPQVPVSTAALGVDRGTSLSGVSCPRPAPFLVDRLLCTQWQAQPPTPPGAGEGRPSALDAAGWSPPPAGPGPAGRPGLQRWAPHASPPALARAAVQRVVSAVLGHWMVEGAVGGASVHFTGEETESGRPPCSTGGRSPASAGAGGVPTGQGRPQLPATAPHVRLRPQRPGRQGQGRARGSISGHPRAPLPSL